MAPLSFLDAGPIFQFSSFPSVPAQEIATSFTTFMSVLNGAIDSVRSLPLNRMLITVNEGTSSEQLQDIVRDLDIIMVSESVQMLDDQLKSIRQASDTLGWIFQLVTVMVMVVSFFSLNSSMYTNITEQAKEIGILRALGVTRNGIFRIYAYESFALIICSSLLGVRELNGNICSF